MARLTRGERQVLVLMLRPNSSSIFFCANSYNSGLPACPGATTGPGGAGRVICVVCARCTATSAMGELSSRGLFLNPASVLRHMTSSKLCRDASLVFREIQVETRAGDVMAGWRARRGPRRTSDISLQVMSRHKSQPIE